MTARIADAILEVCRKVLPPERPLPLHEPLFNAIDKRHVDDCLRSGWVSTAGPYVERFEAELCRLTGAHHAIATVNGTCALHGALLASGLKPGEEVLVPTLTFVATANAVAYCGAIPHFVEASRTTLGVDAGALERYLTDCAVRSDGKPINRFTRRTLHALIVMHTFGHPADMDRLRTLAKCWNLMLIEDAAESVGSTYKGCHTGTLGRIGTLSFNGNKIVTTGGGGAILTNDAELAENARHLCTTARIGAGLHFVHDRVGYNYRMPSLNAALGLGQLEHLAESLASKRELARRYAEGFADLQGVEFFVPPAEVDSNHWLNTLLLEAGHADALHAVLARLNDDGIHARPAWTPMHRLPMYSACPRMPVPIAEELARCIVNLPSGPALASRAS